MQTVFVVSAESNSELCESVKKKVKSWNANSEFKTFILDSMEDGKKLWHDAGAEAAWDKLRNLIYAAPFSDLGNKREISWSALGIEWMVVFDNAIYLLFGLQILDGKLGKRHGIYSS